MTGLPDGKLGRSGTRLESWKQIAAHVNRHVTTVRRWEKHEGLPVHRHVHSALSSIYAYTSELDAWMQAREAKEFLYPPPAQAPAAAAVYRSTIPPSVLSTVKPSPVPLLGREPEIETLWNVWRTASTGHQKIGIIAGEVGQGKTRLLFEFANLARSQAKVLTGAWDREALVPFAPFVTMLQWVVRGVDSAKLRSVLGRIGGSHELAQLVPEIANSVQPRAPGVEVTSENRRFLMFDAFAQLIAALSCDCPILLLLEDLHWADTGSLLFLRHLIRSTTDAAFCILITYRENEPDGLALSDPRLHDFLREFEPTRIHLDGLPAEDVRRFVDTWKGYAATTQLTDWIVTTTEGNPLFVTEMLKHLDETGYLNRELPARNLGIPDRIREVIRHRFVRLSPVCKKILTLGAFIGRGFSFRLLEVLMDMSEDEMLASIEEALAAKVVNETPGVPGEFSFTHALMAETLYADTMAVRRARLHHRIGKALELLSTPENLRLEELAYHFTEGAVYDREKAIDYATVAGHNAHDRLAFEEAARYYGMAIRTLCLVSPGPDIGGKRVELHILSGRSWFQAGQWAHAKTEFEAALGLLDRSELVKRCELLVNIAEVSFWLMDVPAMRRIANEAELLADRIGRDDLWANARAWMASAQVADGDVLGAIASDRQTLSRVGGVRSFGLARVPLTLYWAGQTGEAALRAEQSVEGARASNDPAFLLYALQHLGICLSGVGRYDEALLAFSEACSLGRDCGSSSLLARATSMSVAPLFSLSEFARATDRAMEARELARRAGFQPPLISAGIDLLLIYARTHDPGRAESLLVEIQQAVDSAGGWHAWKWKMRLFQARAELALSKNEWSEAITFADQAIELSNWRHRPKYQAMALTVRARARHELGVRKAVDDARASVDIARRISDPALLAECLSILLLEDETDESLAESRRTIDKVLLGVTEASLRQSFLTRFRTQGELQPNRRINVVPVESYR